MSNIKGDRSEIALPSGIRGFGKVYRPRLLVIPTLSDKFHESLILYSKMASRNKNKYQQEGRKSRKGRWKNMNIYDIGLLTFLEIWASSTAGRSIGKR